MMEPDERSAAPRATIRMLPGVCSVLLAGGMLAALPVGVPGEPAPIARVERMPNCPAPFQMRDWRKVTEDYFDLAFDFDRRGEFLPLIRWSNPQQTMFAMPSYVNGQGGAEALNGLAALVSGELIGRNMAAWHGHNWARMATNYFNSAEGAPANNIGGGTGGSFWYDTFAAILCCQLAIAHPEDAELGRMFRRTAENWAAALPVLAAGAPGGWPDFEHTGFALRTMTPRDNGRHVEPEGGAAIAWIEYMAWLRIGDARFLAAAQQALRALDRRPPEQNPLYEVTLPYGALLAARLNAEQGAGADVAKWLDWCFEPGDRPHARPFWGVLAARFGAYDVHGLVGSERDTHGYAFAMNSFQWAGALAPLPRYDARYGRAIGKWLLNLANAARLFYPDALPAAQQDHRAWAAQHDPVSCLAYEGLRNERTWFEPPRRRHTDPAVTPFATGDASGQGDGVLNLCLYGSAHVGQLGGIVACTDDEKILRIDLLKTDWLHAPAWPTFLFYNPHTGVKTITVEVGQAPCDLYDAVTHQFLAKNVSGRAPLVLAADSAAVVVLVPANQPVEETKRMLKLGGRVVDYRR